jgi:TetR/AcrR family transcriptional regulator, regulator of autoinduction and epiphytic fitness
MPLAGKRPPRRTPLRGSGEITNQILETATRLFATQGYALTSMEQVAAASGSGKHTVYRRYPSKVALFAAVMEAERQRVDALVGANVSSAAAPVEALRQTLRGVLETCVREEVIAFNRIRIAEAKTFPEVATLFLCEDSPVWARIRAFITEGQAEGRLIGTDAGFLASQLLQGVVGLPLQQMLLGADDFQSTESRDAYFKDAWSYFLRATSADGSVSD